MSVAARLGSRGVARVSEGLAANAALLVVCGLYVCIALAYSLMTPAWEANDESEHVRYIERVVAHRELPRIGPENGHESHQPPLYYVLGALWQSALRIPAFEPDPIPRATPATIVPRRTTREWMLSHEYDPVQRQNAKRVHALRGLSILLGVATVVLTYVAGRLALGRDDFAVAAAAVVAFMPKFDVITATVTNDALVVALSSLALVIALLYMRRSPGRGATHLAAGLGVALGAATLAKLNALPLALPFAAAIALAPTSRARRLVHLAAMTAGFALAAGWWFGRNIATYGDALAREDANAYLRALIPGLIAPTSWTDRERFLDFVPEHLVQTIWYTGGWNQLFAPFAVNLALTMLAAVALFAAGRAYVVGRAAGWVADRRVGTVLALCIVAGLAAVTLIAKDTLQAEGRIAYVGLSAFAILAVAGLTEALGGSERVRGIAAFALPAIVLAFNVYVLAYFVVPLRGL